MASLYETELQRKLYETAKAGLPRWLESFMISKEVEVAFCSIPRSEFAHQRLEKLEPISTLSRLTSGHSVEEIFRDDSLVYYCDVRSGSVSSSCSKPSLNLVILHWLDLHAGQTVLEVGSGGGWLGAMICHIIGEKGFYLGFEIIPTLLTFARETLSKCGFRNYDFLDKNVFDEDSLQIEHFDRIVFTASVYSIPVNVIRSLKTGGILLVPISVRSEADEMHLFIKDETGSLTSVKNLPSVFVKAIGSDRYSSPLNLSSVPKDRMIHVSFLFDAFFNYDGTDVGGFYKKTFDFHTLLAKLDETFASIFECTPAGDVSVGFRAKGIYFLPDGVFADTAEVDNSFIVRIFEKWTLASKPPSFRCGLKARMASDDIQTSDMASVRNEIIFDWSLP